jgi:cytoskeleton protein RodZ
MSEQNWGQEGTAAFAGQPAANDAVTAGALLRRARESAGLHVAALAVSLKVPVRRLEALEEDRWDVLPDAVFVRALASSVCRTLKVDPQPVLDRLPQTAAPRLIQNNEGLNTPFRAPSDGAAPSWRDQLAKPVFLAVFALLLGAIVLIFLPPVRQGEAVAAAAAPAGTPAQALGAPVMRVESVAIDARSTADAPQPVQPPATTTSLLSTAAASPGKMMADSPAAGPDSADVAPAAIAAPAARAAPSEVAGVVVFKAAQPSWVEVTDAKGVIPVRRLLAAGEAAGASGALPMQVVVGRADATEVQVRGKPFDLRSVSRDNVDRFEVK